MKTKSHGHKRNGGKSKRRCKTARRVRRGGNMFHGSGPSAPIVCSAGGSKIPCTAFSAA